MSDGASSADPPAELPTKPLFRALPGNLAPPLRIVPPGWTAVIAFIALTLVGAAGFAAFIPFPRTQAASGYLAPIGGVARVKAPRDGVIDRVNVAVGDIVRAGRPLLTIEYGEELAGGGRLDELQAGSVEQQSSLIDSQIQSELQRRRAGSSELDARINSLQTEIASLREQRRLQTERAEMSERFLTALGGLRDKGLISETQYLARRDTALSQRQSVAELTQRIASSENDLRQARLERTRLGAESADKLAQLEISKTELRQQLGEAAARGKQAITAPVSGQVVLVQAASGQAVDTSKPLLAIAPPDARLQAELFVPAQSIGFIRPGQSVRLSYDAFPKRRFGTYRGQVEQVSGVLLAPDDVVGPVTPAQPSHRIIVRLDGQVVSGGRERAQLRPDMVVHADIVLENRTILQWLIDSLRGDGST